MRLPKIEVSGRVRPVLKRVLSTIGGISKTNAILDVEQTSGRDC